MACRHNNRNVIMISEQVRCRAIESIEVTAVEANLLNRSD